MNTDRIAVIEPGSPAWEFLENAVRNGLPVRVYADQEELKVKIGQGMWSPSYMNGAV